MLKAPTRFTYSDTPKSILKHNTNKNRRRQDADEVADSLLAGIDDTPDIQLTSWERDCYGPLPQKVAAILYVWDSGLDWNDDGTPYQDDAPGYFPHSYHHSVEDAEAMAARLFPGKEASEVGEGDWHIARDAWVVGWDTDRIPPLRPRA